MTRSSASSGTPWEIRYGYTRGVRVGGRIEIAGTVAAPAAGDEVEASAYEQMLRCGEIALAALRELGGQAGDVVRTRMYITDATYADAVGMAHGELFGDQPPASTMVVVAGLIDDAYKVELEVAAVVDP